ncbi:type III-B CRISPR module-associated protein Cmr5 [Caldisericum sp.]|uniref:type III-B CRISPR module-associated protein Cmr5 n=1 Tax=Caldisericum sp. TaxID=2499687 RepID=UPI003D13B56A
MPYTDIEAPISLEHTRAHFAYEKVKEALINIQDLGKKNEFKSWAVKFPSMVATCGLLQTSSFYKEKKRELYIILKDWFSRAGFLNNNQDLLEYLLNDCTDTHLYILMTEESIEFLSWVKRFASILAQSTTNEPQNSNQGEQND